MSDFEKQQMIELAQKVKLEAQTCAVHNALQIGISTGRVLIKKPKR